MDRQEFEQLFESDNIYSYDTVESVKAVSYHMKEVKRQSGLQQNL